MNKNMARTKLLRATIISVSSLSLVVSRSSRANDGWIGGIPVDNYYGEPVPDVFDVISEGGREVWNDISDWASSFTNPSEGGDKTAFDNFIETMEDKIGDLAQDAAGLEKGEIVEAIGGLLDGANLIGIFLTPSETAPPELDELNPSVDQSADPAHTEPTTESGVDETDADTQDEEQADTGDGGDAGEVGGSSSTGDSSGTGGGGDGDSSGGDGGESGGGGDGGS